MSRRRTRCVRDLSLLLLWAWSAITPAEAADHATISGHLEGSDGRSLGNAIVRIADTHLATLTDKSGDFVLRAVPPGRHRVLGSMLGYRTGECMVEASPRLTAVCDLILRPQVYTLDEVVVIGEIAGAQAAALNAQRAAANIKSVTSQDLFSRFADINAAETLQRLPGIAIDRDQGEGEFVHIRGLDAQLNSVTVNGQRIPGPSAEVNEGRAVGMDLIHSNNTEFIEVTKALTPDMDADAIGGTVNMVLKSPPKKPEFSITLSGGANAKATREPEWGSEVANLDLSGGGRVLGGRLGLLATGSVHRTNRGTAKKEVDYQESVGSVPSLVRLEDYDVLRHRVGSLLGADYRWSKDHESHVVLTVNRFLDDEIRRRRQFNPEDSNEEKEIRNRREDQHFYMLNGGGTYHRRALQIDYVASISEAGEELPDRTYFRYIRTNDFTAEDGRSLTNEELLDLDLGSSFPRLDPLSLFLVRYDLEKTVERDWSGGIDVQTGFGFRDGKSTVKAGFKGMKKRREATDKRWEFEPDSTQIEVMAENQFAMQDLKYDEPMAVDLAPLNGYVSKLQPLNYEVDEEVLAAFIQSDLNWTSRLSTVVGVRTEVTSQSYEHDVSFEASNERYWNLFPSFHATYRMSRINVRFALTSGLSRPEYTRLLPAEGVVDGKFILGNPDLKPVRSYGADLLLEMYPHSLSVFSCGLFAKRLLDPALDFRFEREIAGVSFTAFEPVNGESGYVAGAEASAVHHLASTGIHSLRHFGTYANYGFARSRIDYGNIRLGDGPMLNSARHTDNLGLFYDNPRVSFTVSYTYRSPLLRTVSADPRDDVWWQSEHRADASVKVDLTRQAQLFLKANNLTNETQREVYGDPYDLRASPLRFRKREEYGRTALVGLAYSL